MQLLIIPVKIEKQIVENDDIAELIVQALRYHQIRLLDKDIVVIAQKVISKSENRLINLNDVYPTRDAIKISLKHAKDPRLIEIILRESKSIVRVSEKHLITETKHGFICANAGIDQSNVSADENIVLLLPTDPDNSAKKIRMSLLQKTDRMVSVIISDTFGRPFRNGQTNIAIGISGISPLKSYIGKKDTFGKILKVTEIAVVDELCSAAEMVMGKNLGIPVAIIRGYEYDILNPEQDEKNNIHVILREEVKDLFRH
ncbi:MAG: coenzyme F420-0:L-glutamate ligase [Thermoproteota archaeon]|nr:coenzyme F420-0:L-glutamate ligase [Thermoproteota archaeon]